MITIIDASHHNYGNSYSAGVPAKKKYCLGSHANLGYRRGDSFARAQTQRQKKFKV